MDSVSQVAVRPAEGLGGAVIEPHVAQDLAHQVEDGAEDAPAEAISGDKAEPDFHLVPPRGIGRCEMELHVRMTLAPGAHGRGLVRREVVQNQVNLFPSLAHHSLVQKPHKRFTGVTGHAAAVHFAGVNLQGGQQGDGSVAHILHTVPLGFPARKAKAGWVRSRA